MISIIFFLYALATFLTQPNDHVTWFSVLSKGFLGVLFGILYLVLGKQQFTNIAIWSKLFVKIGIGLVILFLLFGVFIYVIFYYNL